MPQDVEKTRLMPRREVQQRFGMRSANTFRGYVGRGLITKPIRTSDCPTTPSLWPEREIDAIVAARIRGADDQSVRALVVALEAARVASPWPAEPVDDDSV